MAGRGTHVRGRDSESAAGLHARSTFRPTIGEGLVLVRWGYQPAGDNASDTRDLPSQVSLACIIHSAFSPARPSTAGAVVGGGRREQLTVYHDHGRRGITVPKPQRDC